MKKIFFAVCFIALIISPVYALEVGAIDSTSMNLMDATGGGPGVLGIAKSASSYVVYSGAASAGFGAGAAGQVMGVVAFSDKAIPQVQLMFGARSSNDTAVADDNSIYQDPNGTAKPFTTGTADSAVADATMANWLTRGGS